jgi:hypothetical protein
MAFLLANHIGKKPVIPANRIRGHDWSLFILEVVATTLVFSLFHYLQHRTRYRTEGHREWLMQGGKSKVEKESCLKNHV